MATFNEDQADACTIIRCDSFKTDGVHQYWVIAVLDENNCSYEWKDNTTPGNADDSAIKAATRAQLLLTEMKEVQPVKTVDSNDDIIGNTVG
jgi:hypothetical protein